MKFLFVCSFFFLLNNCSFFKSVCLSSVPLLETRLFPVPPYFIHVFLVLISFFSV